MFRRSKHLNENGFTLIDVLIAIVLLAFGALAYGQFAGNIIVDNDHNKRVTTATLRAQEEIELLKNQATNAALVNATNVSAPTGDAGFTRTYTITNGGAGNLSTISVTVSWTDRVAQTVTLQTQISQCSAFPC